MAAFWEGLVCGVHNADNWEFSQGGDPCVFAPPLSSPEDISESAIFGAGGWV